MSAKIQAFKSGWSDAQLRVRFKASGVHLSVSALIAICITIPTLIWLYPAPFFQAAGGMMLMGLILTIDVTVGPLLTFLVYDRRKKSLGKDLAVICALQIAALVYGLYATAMSRPVFMTYVVDRFEMVSAAEVDEEELKRAPLEFQKVGWGHPQIAYAEQPADPDERSTIMFAFINSGIDLRDMFRYYKPFSQATPSILERATSFDELRKFNSTKDVDEVQQTYGKGRTLKYLPLQGKKRDLTVLVDAQDGSLLKVVDLRPWR